ncbi:MAG: molybdate ABC transporter substrate-binding protein [Desulfobaccales bacterium]
MSFFIKKTLALFLAVFMGTGLAASQDTTELTVSAAASLTNAFQEMGKLYEQKHPQVKMVFNFAASGTLLQQIEKGAPVDVFASADQKTMEQAQEKNLIVPASRKNFVSNRLVLIVPGGAKEALADIKALAQPSIKRIALGNPEHVPAGRYTQEALQKLGLWETLSSKFIFGESVRQVLDYAARGEVEAAFVFATDAAVVPDKVKVVQEIKEHRPILYPMAIVAASKRQAAAQNWLDYVLSPEGQAILARYGFGAP